MKVTKILSIIYLVLVFVFAMRQTAYSDKCTWKTYTPPDIIWAELCDSCLSLGHPYCKSSALTKLDLATGVYKLIGVFTKDEGGTEAVSFPANIAVLENDEPGLSYNIVSLSTMKVLGKITVDVQSWGEDLCQIRGESSALISPDGTRLAIPYIPNEQKDCTQAIAIFDLKTYKLINTLYNMALGEFSSDGKFLYAYSTPTKVQLPIGRNLYLIDTSTGKIVTQLDVTTLIVYPNLDKDYWIGRYAEDGKVIKIFQFKDVSTNGSPSFLYNMDTKAATPTIITVGYSCAGEGSWSQCLPHLSPGANWWIADNVQHNQITIYNVSTGSKVAGFMISLSTGKGAIISWANDHTFIYNTTQKLIYFDIKQNKIVKELPIIRPWEKKGWKPEVGK